MNFDESKPANGTRSVSCGSDSLSRGVLPVVPALLSRPNRQRAISLVEWLKVATSLLTIVQVLLLVGLTAQTRGNEFWDIAEGFTVDERGGMMQVSWRMFSAPDPVCRGVPSRLTLSAPDTPSVLVANEPFDLNTLGVAAMTSNGRLVARVPITIQLRDDTRPRLDIEEFRTGVGPVVPVGPGTLTFRVRAVCSDPQTEAFVAFEVRH
jgi:hypothetical protein